MKEMVGVVVLMVILATRVPSKIEAQSSSCQNQTATLSPCYFYIDGTDSTPSPRCCNRFGYMVNTQPQCLCQVVKDKGLNQTRVSQLPAACNVQTPPISYCYSPPSSGYSTKISNSLLLSLLTVASYAAILVVI